MSRIWLAVAVLMLMLNLSGCGEKQPVSAGPLANPQEGQDTTNGYTDAYLNFMQHTYTFMGEDMDPNLSPDGKWLVYASTTNSHTPDIFMKPVNGKSYTQRTYDAANDRFPRFSPDGKWIIFASDRAGNWDLYLMPTEPDPKKPIRLTRREGDELRPSWSPDGMQVTYNYFNSRKKEWEIWALDMGTLNSRYICDGIMPEWCPNPARNFIAFQRYRERNLPWFGVWTVNAEFGRESEQTAVVTEGKWAAINPAWSPDGEKIMFATVYKSAESRAAGSVFSADDLWMVDWNGENQQQITNDAIPDWSPWWAKDGRVYFLRCVNGQKNIWSLRPEAIQIAMPAAPPAPNLTAAPPSASATTVTAAPAESPWFESAKYPH